MNDYRELKLLLDMYKGVGKEQRDKVQLMAAEKKARQEVEELKAQVRFSKENRTDFSLHNIEMRGKSDKEMWYRYYNR